MQRHHAQQEPSRALWSRGRYYGGPRRGLVERDNRSTALGTEPANEATTERLDAKVLDDLCQRSAHDHLEPSVTALTPGGHLIGIAGGDESREQPLCSAAVTLRGISLTPASEPSERTRAEKASPRLTGTPAADESAATAKASPAEVPCTCSGMDGRCPATLSVRTAVQAWSRPP